VEGKSVCEVGIVYCVCVFEVACEGSLFKKLQRMEILIVLGITTVVLAIVVLQIVKNVRALMPQHEIEKKTRINL
jgi:hypothetical protein